MLELKASIREKTGNQVNSLRQKGLVPAVLYRKGKANVNLQLNAIDFKKAYEEAGESTIIKLTIEGESDRVDLKTRERNVLVADIARDPVSDDILHVDFYEVRMDEKITASVPLEFVGESPAVKTMDGTLVRSIQEVEIKALPADLPRQIEVDISGLATFDDQILVKDIKLSDKVEIIANPDDVVALAMPPRKEEEVVEAVPAEGVEAVEGEEGAPAEGEEKVEEGGEKGKED